MDILSSFSVQPLSLSLLHGPITFLLVSSHLFSFQRHEFICGTFEKPISWLFLQILWYSSYYPKSSILLLSSLLLLFFLFLFFFFFFSFSFFCSYFSYFFLFFPFSLPLFVFAILTFSTLVSTAYYTSLNTLSFSLLLPSSQFQDCGKLAIIFSKLHSTSDH